MNKRQLIKSIIVICGLSFSSVSMTSLAEPMAEFGGKKMMRMLSKKLELSEEQMNRIKEIKQTSKLDREQQRTEMQSYRAQVKELTEADEFDEQAFLTLNTSYQQFFQASALAKAKAAHAINQVLTAEQKLKLVDLKKQRKMKRSRH